MTMIYNLQPTVTLHCGGQWNHCSVIWGITKFSWKKTAPSLLLSNKKDVHMRTYCCTCRQKQGHTSGVITNTKWGLSAGSSLFIIHQLNLCRGWGISLKATLYVQHRAAQHGPGPSQVNWHVDRRLLQVQRSSGQDCYCMLLHWIFI